MIFSLKINIQVFATLKHPIWEEYFKGLTPIFLFDKSTNNFYH